MEGMQPLKIKARCVADSDTRAEHIKYALDLHEKKRIKLFAPSPVNDAEIAIIGSGPSVRTQLGKIKKLAKSGVRTIACKGAHDWMLKNKLTPWAGLLVDPQEHMRDENFLIRPGGIIYFIATQAHPAMFDALLDGYKDLPGDQSVVGFHLAMKSHMDLLRGHVQVVGGSTSGLRAMVLAHMMGFRKMHLFGFDSCLAGGSKGNHLRKITGQEWGTSKEHQVLPLWIEGREFRADPAMASQANEFQEQVKFMEGAKILAHGDGMIQYLCELKAKNGEPGFARDNNFSCEGVPVLRPQVHPDLLAARSDGACGVLRGAGYNAHAAGGGV